MDIVCEKCESKFKVPEDKLPEGKTVTLACPKCKNKLTITSAAKPPQEVKSVLMDDIHAETYDASEKPFDFVEEDGKTALICESDPDVNKKLLSVIRNMEYHVTDAKDTRVALKNMRYHVYDLIVLNESFDTMDSDQNGVLRYLERLPMEVRRYLFVTLISRRYRTMDNMMAFNKSVNMIVNVKNIGDIEKILPRGITDNDLFYRVYGESLKKAGRA